MNSSYAGFFTFILYMPVTSFVDVSTFEISPELNAPTAIILLHQQRFRTVVLTDWSACIVLLRYVKRQSAFAIFWFATLNSTVFYLARCTKK